MTNESHTNELQPLNHPNINPSIKLLTDFFGRKASTRQQTEIRNPHKENAVPEKVKQSARKASVLFLLVEHDYSKSNTSGLSFILTRRSENIRFGGHLCLPGGTQDESDNSSTFTALREAQEEIGLPPSKVEVLGTLGKYYSQAGYCITPVFGIANHPLELKAQTAEVSDIYEVPLEQVFRSDSYTTNNYGNNSYYHFNYQELTVRGPTASLLIGFYEALLGFQK
ncbi:MAG: CoA pyrophosphatase [Pseudomonadales bacterium]|nr:CoA pyrophosphatase [Pseudomonadales bacterium]